MDQLEQNQVALKAKMDTIRENMDQILETMLDLARREDKLQHATVTENAIPILGSTSHSRLVVTDLRYDLSNEYTPPQVEDPIWPQEVHITISNEIPIVQGNHTAKVGHIPPPHAAEEPQFKYCIQGPHEEYLVTNVGSHQNVEAI